MVTIEHAMDVAKQIIANQKPKEIDLEETITVKKYTKTEGPTTQILVTPTNPARIINEIGDGGIVEFIAISPSENYSVEIESNGETILNHNFNQLNAINLAGDIKAFVDAEGNYVLNIKNYSWEKDFILTLRSTSGSFKFNQVYVNYYVYR